MFNERPQGALPSNTVPNPREQINAITTWSGKANDGPLIPSPVSTSSSPPMVERDPETSTDKVHISSSGSTAHVPPLESHAPIFDEIRKPKAKKVNNDESQEPNPYQPRIPYPARLNVKASDRFDAQMSRFVKMFKQLRLDIGLSYALIEMPKFNKWLSDLLKNKERLKEIANTLVNAKCSAIILNKVPKKLGDPDKFLIPCSLQDLQVCNSLAYSGASINLLLFLSMSNLGLELWKAQSSADPRVPIILARPFLRTPKGLVDLYKEKITLRVGNEEIVFYADNYLKNKNKQYAHSITIIDFLKDEPISGSTTIHSDTFLLSSPPVETSNSSIDKFVNEVTLLDSFPPNFEDDPVFKRFTFQSSPTKYFSSVIIDNPVLKRISYLFLPPFAINPVCQKFTDELAHPYPFLPGNKDLCFDPGAVCDEIKFLLYRDPSSPPLTIDSILKGFTDEPPLRENDDDDLFDLSTENDEWGKLLYDVPFDNGKSFDMNTFIVKPKNLNKCKITKIPLMQENS
ncbi:hypothetical protein Tco_0886327 [Tanacetum coccineum]